MSHCLMEGEPLQTKDRNLLDILSTSGGQQWVPEKEEAPINNEKP